MARRKAPPKQFRFSKGSGKAKAAGRKSPGSSRKGAGSKMPPQLKARFQKKGKR